MSELLVVWRVSAAGIPCECGTYAYPLYFPLFRVAADGWKPLGMYRCATHLPEGAQVYRP